jgi:hypothetical protein
LTKPAFSFEKEGDGNKSRQTEQQRNPYTEKPVLGSIPAPGVAGRASRPVFGVRRLFEPCEFFDALDVSREGAENGTRGACAPPD